jgi:hypothetical protein
VTQIKVAASFAAVKQALTEIDPIQALTIALITFKDELHNMLKPVVRSYLLPMLHLIRMPI